MEGFITKKRWKVWVLVVGALVLSIAIIVHAQERENKWDYRPMISLQNRIYGDTGHTQGTPLEDWVLLGKVGQNVPQTEPMVKGKSHFVSNTLPVGAEIYGDQVDETVIWARHNEVFIRYELIEE